MTTRPQTHQQKRRRAEGAGRKAEFWAALYLRLKGYSLVTRRAKTPVGEIDLVMRHKSALVFVEVKWRRDIQDARQSIGPAQQRRIAKAAQYFVASRPAFGDLTWRFDAVLMAPGKLPCHILDAWRE